MKWGEPTPQGWGVCVCYFFKRLLSSVQKQPKSSCLVVLDDFLCGNYGVP